MLINPFRPIVVTKSSGQVVAAPVQVSASTTAATFTLPGNTSGDVSNVDIRVENQTASWAFVLFGDGSQGAATTANAIGFAPNSVEVMEVPSTCNGGSVILATGTGTVAFERGLGV